MKNSFLKICSIFLVLVLLANMLPLQVFAQQLNTGKTEPIVTAPEQAADETATERVIAEIKEKRTEFSKEFLLSSGLRMVTVYPEAVHYAANTGWEEIDNTLIAKADGTITNTAGVWDVSFPQQLSKDKSITIEKDGHTLSFFMSGELTSSNAVVRAIGSAQAETLTTSNMRLSTATTVIPDLTRMRESVKYAEMVPEKVSSQITYANVYQNTDIIYDLESNKVKESVILESYRSNLRGYRYTLDVGTMIPVVEEDGQILFYDANKENVVMVMPAPYMIDDAGARNDDVSVQLTGSGSRYTLTYLLPQQWLAEEDRAWPVVLDPVVYPELSVSNIWDRTIAEYKEHSRISTDNICGYTWDGGVTRFFLMYNALPRLTSSDVIVNATLNMDVADGTDSTIPIYVHKVNSTWSSSNITWDDQPNYKNAAEDYAMTVIGGSYTWDITDIAQEWYARENTGMMFKAGDDLEDAMVNNYRVFPSSECGTELSWPILSISIRNNNGLESYWDYTSASAGRAGTGYVNNYTGNLVWIRNDIGFGGNRMPVSINHIYNTNDAQYFQDIVGDFNNSNNTAGNHFGLGYGWRTNYNQLVYRWETDILHDEHYIWEDADGTDHYFKLDETTGGYKDEDGLELILTLMPENPQNYKYKITDKNGNASYFDEQGRLAKMENNQEAKSFIEIAYWGETYRIATITDGAKRTYVFEYDIATELLTKICYTGSGTEEISSVYFEYNGSKLWRITDKDGGISTYTYYNYNLLETAQDVDGYQLTYEYNAVTYGKPARIVSVQSQHNDEHSGSLVFEYDHNLTRITDHNGNVQIMQFNDMGNTVCIQDDEGRAQYAQFAKNDGEDIVNKSNQLQLSSKLQNTVSNILNNNSFENGTLWNTTASSVSIDISTAQVYCGNQSHWVYTTQAATGIYEQVYTVGPKETITFSAYVKTGTAAVALSIFDWNSFTATEIQDPNTHWTRLEISYTNTTDVAKSICPHILSPSPGSFWIDNVQLEYTSTASRYNLVENGNFAYGTSGYTTPSDSSVVATPAGAIPQLQGTAVSITGDPTAQKQVSQTVAISGQAQDSFVYAAWAKGDSASLWPRQYELNTRTFAVEMQFNYTDGTKSDNFSAQFNPDTDKWQYAAGAGVAAKAYSSVTVTVSYDYNINTAYFDGIQLFKEEFGTSYTYDDKGNIISVVDLQKKETTYEYDTDSNLTRILEDNEAKMSYTYDQWHNVETATTEQGQVYIFDYDTYGNNTSVTIATDYNRITTSATYSADGNRLVSTTDALGNVTTYGYNADTNVLEWVEDPEDTAATRTTYTYDDMYRVATVNTPKDGENDLSAYYTYYDDLLYYLDTMSTSYRFEYGHFGLRTGVYAGEGLLAEYTYTDDGNNYLSALDYGNGDRVEYNYDNKGRLTLETFEDDETVTYTYNSYGNLATVTDSETGITTTYYYDLLDRMVKYRETGGGRNHTVTYTYNGDNNLSSVEETIDGIARTTEYAYNDDNRIVAVDIGRYAEAINSVEIVASESYYYDELGRIDQIITDNTAAGAEVLTKNYIFKNPSATTTSTQIAINHIQATVGEGTGATGYEEPEGEPSYVYGVTYSYTYDDNGNILSISDDTYTTSYEYDSANQLVRENNQQLGFTKTWEYDNGGNITFSRKYTYTTGSLNNLEPVEVHELAGYGMSGMGDLFAEYDGQVMTYDAIGNPLYDGKWTYTWEHGRELVSMSDGGYNAWEFTYDANGMRTQRTDGYYTYSYIYNGSQLSRMIVLYDGGEHYEYYELDFAYSADGTPMTVTFEGCTYYYVTNIQGDVIAILDDVGRLICRYVYDAWGNVTTYGERTDNVSYYNPLRYRGYVYDWETNLYYLQSRYYSPEQGRFLNADAYASTSQGVLGNNMFVYCLNNPVNMYDSTGCVPKWLETAWNWIEEKIVQPIVSFAEDFKNDDGSYSLYDNHRHDPNNIFHEQILSVDMSKPSFDLKEEGALTLGEASVTIINGGWETEYLDLSLLDLGHAQISAGYQEKNLDVSAMISIWTPSVTIKAWDVSMTISLHIGSIGGMVDVGSGKFTIGAAYGWGASLSFN